METIARPYARAIFSLAKEDDRIDEWMILLEHLAALMRIKDFAVAVKDPTQSIKDKSDMLVKALADLNIGDKEKNLIFLLIDKRRFEMVATIRDLLAKMRSDADNKLEINISTAYELSDEERQNLVAKFSSISGKQASIKEKVDKSLIGGLIIEWDGETLDSSIRGRLEKLSASL